MKYYVNLRHPLRTGETIQAIPVGKTRTADGGGTEALVRVITPKADLEEIWISRDDILET